MPRHHHTPLTAAALPLAPPADAPAAVARWLARAHGDPARAHAEWQELGLAVLPLGRCFSAVRMPDPVVAAAARCTDRAGMDAYLAEAVGALVICDPRWRRYYALVSRRMPEAWRHFAEAWQRQGVDLLGDGWQLGVPCPSTRRDPHPLASYWAVPPQAGALCPPLAVVQLIDAALARMTEADE